MKRREFITFLGSALAIWPLASHAQQDARMRRVGILMPFSPSDKEMQDRVEALKKELQNRGWSAGVNVQFDERWTTDNMDLVRANAANLVELKPDVIVAIGGRVIPVLMQLTRTVPIIIPGSASPVEAGFIKSLARPGGNVTGFATLELSVIGRILETLKQIAPGTSRVAMIYNPDNPAAINYRGPFESSALPLSVQPIIAPIHSIADIERAIEALAAQPNGGVFFPPDVTTFTLCGQVNAILARHRVPAIYTERRCVTSGGLVSYDADRTDIFRRTASYVDRVLRGEKPGGAKVRICLGLTIVVNRPGAICSGAVIPDSR